MGDPRKLKKKYSAPKKPWDKTRILYENELVEKYGLKNKKEIWRIKTILDKKRKSARIYLAADQETMAKGKKILIGSLAKMGLLPSDATLDDVLTLKVEDFLERRLQTLVYRKGLANTIKQARQFIVHGFIAINGKRVRSPSYFVPKDLENKIGYYNNKKPKVLEVELKQPILQKEGSEKNQAKEVVSS